MGEGGRRVIHIVVEIVAKIELQKRGRKMINRIIEVTCDEGQMKEAGREVVHILIEPRSKSEMSEEGRQVVLSPRDG